MSYLIPITNLFYKWMYYFDTQNIYHRMFGWYIFAGLNGLSIIALFLFVVMQRHSISRYKRITLSLFLIFPFIGIALQALHLGISFTHLGMAISTIALLIEYMIEWSNSEKSINDFNEQKKILRLIEGYVLIMILCMSAAVMSCVISVYTVSNKESEHCSISLAHKVSETVDSILVEPINVSKTMAQTPVIIDALSQEQMKGTELEQKMISFMNHIQNEYGYQMVFVASEHSKAYYTYKGFSRYMDVEGYRDAWYNEFKDRNIPYELNVDTDKDIDMTLSLFVNTEVRDEKGELIGVCGVAMPMDQLIDILSSDETKYNLSISVINKEGLVQVGTKKDRIEKEYLDITYLNNLDDSEFNYNRNKSEAILVKQVKGQDWYLVIEDKNPDKINVIPVIMPGVIIYLIGIAVMILFAIWFGLHEKKRNIALHSSRKKAETDCLTSLKNRYSMEIHSEEIDENGFPEHFSFAMIDVNGLKTVNDTIGHAAGDELIIGAAKCLSDVFFECGEVYRVGGDEFVAMCICNDEKMEALVHDLEKKIEGWRGDLVKELSISIGVASHKRYPECSIFELARAADKLMYQNKDAYYLRTGKERRKRR